MSGKKKSEELPYCERCIYRPCGRAPDKRRYCLVRVLLAELDEWTRLYRAQRKKEKNK
jgi:hypothetical protein